MKANWLPVSRHWDFPQISEEQESSRTGRRKIVQTPRRRPSDGAFVCFCNWFLWAPTALTHEHGASFIFVNYIFFNDLALLSMTLFSVTAWRITYLLRTRGFACWQSVSSIRYIFRLLWTTTRHQLKTSQQNSTDIDRMRVFLELNVFYHAYVHSTVLLYTLITS